MPPPQLLHCPSFSDLPPAANDQRLPSSSGLPFQQPIVD
jgi:hypothetical protein